MAEMLIQRESLTSIADRIRVLSGTAEPMDLDAMESHVDEANMNVATEADLIAQIATALEDKAAGGVSVDMCTVNFEIDGSYTNLMLVHYTTVDENGKVIGALLTNVALPTSIQCVCRTPIDGILPPTSASNVVLTNIAQTIAASSNSGTLFYGMLTAPAGGTATFTFN